MMATSMIPDTILDRIRHIRQGLGRSILGTGNPRLVALWQTWDQQLCALAAESSARPEVEIAMVGGTGAGKSTLLNALLDARLLPVSNMRACTAAICQVAYQQGDVYTATIEFVPRATWHQELDLLRADLEDQHFWSDPVYAEEGGQPPVAISRVARDKLTAVYGLSGDTDFGRLDARTLVEPEPIAAALDAGVVRLTAASQSELKDQVAIYLDSQHEFWPIVKRVAIAGPFKALRQGATLIDLPGINDPNEAREEVTRQYLKTCRFVWIVFNIKRVLTRDTIELMESEDFLRQIVMDGRSNALTFIGTASDDVDPESGRQEFGLHEDADDLAVIQARNAAVRGEVGKQLEDLAHRLVAMAGENRARADALSRAFTGSNVFTVSAREYQRLTGQGRMHAAGLETPAQTEIPELRHYMDRICAEYGIAAQTAALNRRIDAVLEEIDGALRTQRVQFQRQDEETDAERQEVVAAAGAARTFLRAELARDQERFVQDLAAREALLRERLKRGVERARSELQSLDTRWSTMHWCTLRAVARRGGVFAAKSGQHDFAADIARPILNTVTFAWADFFGDSLGTALDRGNEYLLETSAAHAGLIIDAVAGRDAGLRDNLERIAAGTARILEEQLGQTKLQMGQTIEGVQRTLHEEMPRQVRINMKPAFEAAGLEKGPGVKLRMVEILTRHARQVSAAMFADVEGAIHDGVRDLLSGLRRQFEEMGTTVSRQAELMAESLSVEVGDGSQGARE